LITGVQGYRGSYFFLPFPSFSFSFHSQAGVIDDRVFEGEGNRLLPTSLSSLSLFFFLFFFSPASSLDSKRKKEVDEERRFLFSFFLFLSLLG